MKRALEWGGLAAGAVMIVFGLVTIVMAFDGRQTVNDSLKKEYIVGSADMTPALIKEEAKKAGLDVASLSFPTVSVGGKQITNGERAINRTQSSSSRGLALFMIQRLGCATIARSSASVVTTSAKRPFASTVMSAFSPSPRCYCGSATTRA